MAERNRLKSDLITSEEVRRRLGGISRNTLTNMINNGYFDSRTKRWIEKDYGNFPKPVLVGGGSHKFLESEIDAWILSRRSCKNNIYSRNSSSHAVES